MSNIHEDTFLNETTRRSFCGGPDASDASLLWWDGTVILFKGLDSEIVLQICTKLEPYPAQRGEYITEEGKLAKEMFILIRGK